MLPYSFSKAQLKTTEKKMWKKKGRLARLRYSVVSYSSDLQPKKLATWKRHTEKKSSSKKPALSSQRMRKEIAYEDGILRQ